LASRLAQSWGRAALLDRTGAPFQLCGWFGSPVRRLLVWAALEISHAQKLAWNNKVAKGFNTTDVALEFGLLTAEVGEAFTAWRKRLPDLGEELADVVIYAMALAEMTGLDLDSEVERKIAKNRCRVYARDSHGVPVRVAEAESPKPGPAVADGRP
jgi:NTP pyrophosphatase (non-canonical NTP hydrolase)